jgi:hypothetical protein
MSTQLQPRYHLPEQPEWGGLDLDEIVVLLQTKANISNRIMSYDLNGIDIVCHPRELPRTAARLWTEAMAAESAPSRNTDTLILAALMAARTKKVTASIALTDIEDDTPEGYSLMITVMVDGFGDHHEDFTNAAEDLSRRVTEAINARA